MRENTVGEERLRNLWLVIFRILRNTRRKICRMRIPEPRLPTHLRELVPLEFWSGNQCRDHRVRGARSIGQNFQGDALLVEDSS